MFENILKWAKKSPTINDFDEYQLEARRTRGTRGFRDTMLMCGFGLAGETGEVVEILKKALFHGKKIDIEEFKSELGDLLWYIAVAADVVGIDLSEIARHNREKLRKRYPDGFVPFNQRKD